MCDSVPSMRYSIVCNVLCLWRISLIPTYRVYRLYDIRMRNHCYSSNLTFYMHQKWKLLSLLVETGQCPGAGLTWADKTCIQLNFNLEISKGGAPEFQGGQEPPAPPPPKCNPGFLLRPDALHSLARNTSVNMVLLQCVERHNVLGMFQ